ncbi:CvpA family protein [Spirochaeta thermophila]|uniref:Colicin V production protein n=1 Tax=Winmispira thermophila (strain ATCC 49972 / DSM 6192 / RI 19.B1) TaxID=665571 RepID=E0RQK6_WINT6|nr:CvpA family protein [Spirochaeta thermophila]ADN01510.1 hypothetical protein STHERM_c05410 [Spirochaeta thermophila DSM 6192]
MNLTALDVVFLGVIGFFIVQGLIKGFIQGFMSVLAVGGGLTAGALFSSRAAGLFDALLGASPWSPVLGFLSLFIVVYAVVKLLENALQSLIERVHLENLDKALGFFLGILKGIVVVAVILLILEAQPFVDTTRMLGTSLFARLLLPLLPDPTGVVDAAREAAGAGMLRGGGGTGSL